MKANLDKIERIFVKYALKPHLTPPFSDYMTGQILKVLEKQKEEGEKSEIGGVILQNGKGLELKIIKPKSLIEREKALEEFVAENYSNSDQLVDLLDKTIEVYKYHYPENKLRIIYNNLLYEEMKEAITGKSSKEQRKEIASGYQKFVLATSYTISLEEFLENSPYVRGAFHVHHNASEPSAADVSYNQKLNIAGLVISATPDYQQSGVKLYLVHSGSFELLYQGPLKPKQ